LDNQTNQLHDFNPGFGDPVNAAGDRTFWTVAIPDGSVRVNPGAGKAEMKVDNLAIEDYFNLANALADGHSVEATVSFDVVWTGDVSRRVNVNDAAHNFAGEFAETRATVSWSASEAGFTFASDPASTSTSHFAETGHDHNGIFFPSGRKDSTADVSLMQASAMLQAEGLAGHPLSADLATGGMETALRTFPNHSVNGEAQSAPAGALRNGSADHFTDKATAVVPTQQNHVFKVLPDLAATRLFAEIGLQGTDVLFR
jgi:hypothetical protein